MPSDGARQSPRGDRLPPPDTFGPFGMAERLNWLKPKNRRRNSSSQPRMVSRSYSLRRSSGNASGHWPAEASCHACQARKATFDGAYPWRTMWCRKKSWSS